MCSFFAKVGRVQSKASLLAAKKEGRKKQNKKKVSACWLAACWLLACVRQPASSQRQIKKEITSLNQSGSNRVNKLKTRVSLLHSLFPFNWQYFYFSRFKA
jgi:hypothetical protein